MRKLVLVMSMFFLFGCGGSDVVHLNASHSFDSDFLFVKNEDVFDYTDVDVSINEDYNYHVDRINAGKDVSIPLGSFLNGDMRFDISKKSITQVKISCETGKGFGFKGWNK